MKKILVLFILINIITSCSYNDDSNQINNIKQKKIKKQTYYVNDFKSNEIIYEYDSKTGFVSIITQDNRTYKNLFKYEYAKNNVKEYYYLNNELKQLRVYTYKSNILKEDIYNSNSELIYQIHYEISNKKIKTEKMYDANNILDRTTDYTYENNGLRLIKTETCFSSSCASSGTKVITYSDIVNYNFITPFAYLVDNKENLILEDISYDIKPYSSNIYYKYEFDQDNYPIVTNELLYYESVTPIITKIITEYL